MTKKHSVWILLSFLLATLTSAGVFAEDLTVDEIIAKHVETIGGEEAWKAVDSATMTASFNAGPMAAGVTMVFKRPNKFRMETEFQGMKIIQAFDGEKGWGVMPMMGSSEPELAGDEEVKNMESQADLEGPLVGYKEKGHTVELIGKEEVEGTEAYELKVTQKNGDVIHMFLDTEYCLVFRQKVRRTVQGTEVNVTVNFSDYKEVGDVVMAHSIEQLPEGAPQGMVITVDKVELNTEVDDAQFTFPGKPEGESTEEMAEE